MSKVVNGPRVRRIGRSVPDLEGLRAVAVGLVVLYHAGVTALQGGYVGVDVFFVISGFLITGLLLRERLTTGSTSLLTFYARRTRRILPAASLILVLTIVASYSWLGILQAGRIARDGEWTALFAANLNFALQGTQYLNATQPPSPLQHYWSLAVEEQFYFVWPALFAGIATLGGNARLRVRLAVVLAVIIVVSFAWSVIQTPVNGNWAFFSPLTRAWELAVGALLAVGFPALRRLPVGLAGWMGCAGLAAVLISAFAFGERTQFPGYAAAIPVLGAALVIAAGTIEPYADAEHVLRSVSPTMDGETLILAVPVALAHPAGCILVLAGETDVPAACCTGHRGAGSIGRVLPRRGEPDSALPDVGEAPCRDCAAGSVPGSRIVRSLPMGHPGLP